MTDNTTVPTTEEMNLYYEAYYGSPVPLSQVPNIQNPFLDMVKTMKADIMNHLIHAGNTEVKAGILEGLSYLCSTGQNNYPDLYLRNPHHAKEAFKYAIAATTGKPLKRELITPKEQTDAIQREQEATREMIDESNQRAEEQASERDSISAPLYKEYNRTKQMLIMNGESTHESKIGAYRALLGTWEYQGGVDYFVVGWKIPHEEEIYDEPEVIDMMNAHHALRGMGRQGPTQMRVNDKAWEGLK